MTYRLDNRDAVDYLRSLPDESVDCFITDIAYESLEKHRGKGTTTRLKQSKASSNEWFAIFPNARLPELFSELYHKLRRNSHLYFFCDAETMFVAKPIGEAAGFKFWKPIVWDKMAMGMGYHYRARHEWILEFTKGDRPEVELPADVDPQDCFIDPRYEFILFFEKGKRKLRDLSIPDVLEFKRVHRGYPTEKPVPLMEVLVEQSTTPGDTVCDPFMGSCPVGEASLRHGRHFLGNDLSGHACQVATERLEKLARGAPQ